MKAVPRQETEGSPVVLERVSARYDGVATATDATAALRDVSLELAAGELLAVLGPNGAGKSTLLKVMAGAMKPSAGSAKLFGASVATLDRRELARNLAVVSQTESVAFSFSVREVVAMGRAPHLSGWLRLSESDERIVDEVLERCHLTALRHRSADALSGGERKRVAIARALAQKPRVLLLDEPGAFLDVKHALDLYDLLAEEVARAKLACLVIMHDLNIASQYASRVALMKEGALVAIGGIEQVMTYQNLKATFDTDLYVGVNELTRARFFLPMRPTS